MCCYPVDMRQVCCPSDVTVSLCNDIMLTVMFGVRVDQIMATQDEVRSTGEVRTKTLDMAKLLGDCCD